MLQSTRHRLAVLYVVALLVPLALLTAAPASAAGGAEPSVYVWVDEQPASANFKTWTGGDRPNLLSEGKLLGGALDAQAQKAMPKEGFLLTYKFSVPEAGRYEAWARVGFEWVRAPFEWRINKGEWRQAPATWQTTNVMELKEFNEIAWLDLGPVELKKGAATLTVRFTKPGSNGSVMFMLDCFAFMKGRWVPEGKLKPGQRYDAEIDRQAAAQLYHLPAPAPGARRTEVTLNGLWQVARYDDPDMDVDTFVPVQQVPAPDDYPLRWMGIQVPSSLWDKDETIFAHRVIYRTRVEVPAGYAGRGFKLHFSGTNLIASVFVNGRLAGSHRGVWIPWDLDVSRYIEPGKVNEIAVGIKGPYYAVDVATYGRAHDLDHARSRPRGRQDWVYYVEPIYPSSKGDGNGVDYGIVNPVTLVAVGNAYTEDVFIKPSVDRRNNKHLVSDVTVHNAGDSERTFDVKCEAVYDPTNEVEKTFEPVSVTVPAGESRTVSVGGQWDNPKLWWPKPHPDLYRLRTTISEAGKPLDVQEELFGFRWVTIKGDGIYINNVRRNFWNWVGVQGRPSDGETWLKAFRADNDRFTRFSQNRKTSSFLKSREERLEFYDRNGIPGRLCSMIDGMFINRTLGNRTTNPVTGQGWLDPNWAVWEGFARHMDQLSRAYRNHPSVIMYQVENELIYITGMNIYGAYLDRICDLMNDVIEVAPSAERVTCWGASRSTAPTTRPARSTGTRRTPIP